MALSDLRIEYGYWYAGSPYSKYPTGLDYAFQDISVIIGALLKDGIRAYSPIVHYHPVATNARMDPLNHTLWLWADEPMIDGAYGLIVVMMESWKESKGLIEEIKLFELAGKPVYFLDPKDLGL